MRPGNADSVTEVSSVAIRLMSGGIVMPTRCAAAPSSTGAGILLQSTSSRFFWFIALASAFETIRPHGEEAPSAVPNHETPRVSSVETPAPDSAHALPGERAPPE